MPGLAASATMRDPWSRRPSATTTSRGFGHYLRIYIHLINLTLTVPYSHLAAIL
jgi:hypothetical protein